MSEPGVEDSLKLDEPGEALEPASPSGAAYRVLARKYRPADFSGLIGQDAMVRTLTNAFATGRIAQAYMLTGVRGVGKTTTARILARALNYEADGVTDPTIDITAQGAHCAAIMESRHPDVFEMDAASNTGIDDVREIIGYAQTRPGMARYKVFIIDEVHMLSRQAFNGLLKTLEEPPEHVRFIFATTEIRKVPVTVLSRCQRFDLRRVGVDLLIDHFAGIAEKEGCDVEPAAFALIARAAEGSVRDGLSLLDQAIALGAGKIAEQDVRAMLGLANRTRVINLFGHVMGGGVAAALDEFKAQYTDGADPHVVITDLADFVHLVTRIKVSDTALADPSLGETEHNSASEFAEKLSLAALARAWQMLLKGHREVESARNGLAAAEMVLVRLAHASSLPPPGEIIRQLSDAPDQPRDARSGASPGSPSSDTPPPSGADDAVPRDHSTAPAAELPAPENFGEALRLVGDLDIRLVDPLEQFVRPVDFTPGYIEIELGADAPPDIANRFAATLTRATGSRWVVSVAGDGVTQMREQAAPSTPQTDQEGAEPELVRKVKNRFPDATMVGVRDLPQAGDSDGGQGRTGLGLAGDERNDDRRRSA